MSLKNQSLICKSKKELELIAEALVSPGKGTLAADEALKTMEKRLKNSGLEINPKIRRKYCEILLTCPTGFIKHISGIVLPEEAITLKGENGKYFVETLLDRNIIIGVRIELDSNTVLGTLEENFSNKCERLKNLGCQFVGYRCDFNVSVEVSCFSDISDKTAILSCFAKVCQRHGLVPIIEAKVSHKGFHSIQQCAEVLTDILSELFSSLFKRHVHLEGTLLKTSMCINGKCCPVLSSPEEVAGATVTVLQRTVPVAVPGIVFLATGLSEEMATEYLNAINKYEAKKPWALTFSFGSTLTDSVLSAWAGRDENILIAQKELSKRTRANGLASVGLYETSYFNAFGTEKDLIRLKIAKRMSE